MLDQSHYQKRSADTWKSDFNTVTKYLFYATSYSFWQNLVPSHSPPRQNFLATRSTSPVWLFLCVCAVAMGAVWPTVAVGGTVWAEARNPLGGNREEKAEGGGCWLGRKWLHPPSGAEGAAGRWLVRMWEGPSSRISPALLLFEVTNRNRGGLHVPLAQSRRCSPPLNQCCKLVFNVGL